MDPEISDSLCSTCIRRKLEQQLPTMLNNEDCQEVMRPGCACFDGVALHIAASLVPLASTPQTMSEDCAVGYMSVRSWMLLHLKW